MYVHQRGVRLYSVATVELRHGQWLTYEAMTRWLDTSRVTYCTDPVSTAAAASAVAARSSFLRRNLLSSPLLFVYDKLAGSAGEKLTENGRQSIRPGGCDVLAT